jgi:L-ascorbate metabolism protein UlaG (beta-lactamase superfamily)
MLRVAAILLLGLSNPGWGQGRIDSACLAMAAGEARVIRAAFGAPLAEDTLRVRFLGHASFALETPGGVLAVTDYTGYVGNPEVVPDVVTMNNAHDTHFTDSPDPRIPLVLRGWGPVGLPPVIDEEIGDLRIRNVTSDLRGPFGEGARRDGNSIFVFEAAGLCIGHLGHLHQILSDAQYGAIGRLDVVMVPVDGNFTMDAKTMAAVVSRFRARLILPMHWFSAEGLRDFLVEMGPGFEVVLADGPEIEVSLETLPRRPTLMVLDPALIP